MTTPLPATDWLWLEVASNARTTPDNAGYGAKMLAQGWSVHEMIIAEAYERGFRCLCVHRPFGEADEGDQMDLDSRAEIIDNAHKYDRRAVNLVQTYVPWCESLLAKHPELHIVSYVGTANDSSTRERINQPGRLNEWLDRFNRSLQPVFASPSNQMHICFDAASTYIAANPVAWDMCNLIRRAFQMHGRDCIMEALPRVEHPGQREWPALCLERFWWDRIHKRRHPADQRSSRVMTVRVWNGHAINNGAWGAVRGDQPSIRAAFDAWKADCRLLGHVACWNPRLDGIDGGWDD